MTETVRLNFPRPTKEEKTTRLSTQASKNFTANMQRLDFQVAEESDWKVTNSSENKQIRTTGSRKLYKSSEVLVAGTQEAAAAAGKQRLP